MLRLYLLGDLPEEEQLALERDYFTNPEMLEHVWGIENELVDRYVRGRLDRDEKNLFEQNYLASPVHRERVAFATTLLEAGDLRARKGRAVSETGPAIPWWSAFLASLSGTSLRWATVAAMLFLLGASIVLFSERVRLREQMNQTQAKYAELQQRKQELESQLARERSATAVPTPTPAPEGAAALAIAQLNDGEGRISLDQKGNLSGVDNLPPAYQRMAKEALTSQRLEESSLLAGLKRPASSLMGSDDEGNKFSVTAPVGKVMLSDRPTFRWSQLTGASGYVIEVYDEKFNLVVTSSQLTGNLWTAPQSLKRGAAYSWQVKATKDGQEFKSPRPPMPQAKFRILDQAKASELAHAQRAYPSSHLTLGLLYTQAGLLDEAERELRVLQKANPNSGIARRLLASVQAMRR